MNEKSCSPWKVGKLEDVLELNESGVWGESGTQTDFPVLRSTNIQNGKLVLDDVALRKVKNPEEFMLKDGDILITKSSGSPNLIGKCGIFHHPNDSKEYLFSNFVQRIRANKLMLPEFLYYFLNSDWGKRNLSRLHETTSGLRNLDMNRYVKQEIPIPELETQRIITSVLRKIHDAKQKREQANQLTNKVIQSVFLKMFGKENPANKIEDIATHVSSGSTPLGGEKTYIDEGVTFIRSQNILMNSLDLHDIAHISEKTHNEMRRTWVRNGDVLLNITGASLGRVAVYRGRDDQANVNQHVCIIRVDQSRALPEYVSFFLSSPRAQKQIWTIQAGASRQALNYKQVRSLDIYLPSMVEQSKFTEIVKQIETVKDKQAQSSKETNELFHSLMHKAFKGDLVLEVKQD